MTNIRKKNTFVIIFFAMLVSLSDPLSASPQAPRKMRQVKTYTVAPGTFGGDGIIVTIEKSSVRIEYPCADGEIKRQLRTDKNGYFKVDGFHIGPNAGPIRRDAIQKPDVARYEGKITGNVMTLKVTNLRTGENLGEFTLERGKSPLMHRCA